MFKRSPPHLSFSSNMKCQIYINRNYITRGEGEVDNSLSYHWLASWENPFINYCPPDKNMSAAINQKRRRRSPETKCNKWCDKFRNICEVLTSRKPVHATSLPHNYSMNLEQNILKDFEQEFITETFFFLSLWFFGKNVFQSPPSETTKDKHITVSETTRATNPNEPAWAPNRHILATFFFFWDFSFPRYDSAKIYCNHQVNNFLLVFIISSGLAFGASWHEFKMLEGFYDS